MKTYRDSVHQIQSCRVRNSSVHKAWVIRFLAYEMLLHWCEHNMKTFLDSRKTCRNFHAIDRLLQANRFACRLQYFSFYLNTSAHTCVLWQSALMNRRIIISKYIPSSKRPKNRTDANGREIHSSTFCHFHSINFSFCAFEEYLSQHA